MSSPGRIIQKIFQKPIEHLIMTKKRLPNIQVLRLYRDVWKYSARFYWNNDRGESWRDILRKSARKQFDLSKDQKDSFLIMKMMITTRECLKQMDNKIIKTQDQFVKTVDSSRNQEQLKTAKSTIYK